MHSRFKLRKHSPWLIVMRRFMHENESSNRHTLKSPAMQT